MADIDGTRAVVLNAGFGMPLQALLPSAHGYFALWTFDIDDDQALVSRLLVELSVEEAREVAARDVYREGFLEPVRGKMGDRLAWVMVSPFGDHEPIGAQAVTLPVHGDEPEFAAWLREEAVAAQGSGLVYQEGIPMVPAAVVESTELAYAAMGVMH